jgi:NAD(P)H-nitrite reductase large subunit
MAPSQIVVVGGGPAGLAVVRAYRDAGGSGAISLVCEEADLPYERPPLTKGFLRGECRREELLLETPQWFAERAVEVYLNTRVVALDPAGSEVRLADGGRVAADACVLTTGARPLRPPIPGAGDPDVLQIRRIGDSERLAARAAAGSRALVIGSGFIGCEAAASLAAVGLEVTIVSAERGPQEARLGSAASEQLARWLRDAGVTLLLDVDVQAIEAARRVRLSDGRECAADIVVLAAGVEPNAELAARVGLELDHGGIPVDASMQSAHPFLSAAGDVAAAENRARGTRLRVEHWGDAIAQGEVAGRTLAGESAEWDEVPGFWSTIGSRTLKHAAWGDGFDDARLVEHDGGAFTVWYSRDGVLVGVLTHERDEDYERGRELIAQGQPA